jgi:hypothetical protein
MGVGKKKVFVNSIIISRDIGILSLLRKYNLDFAVIAYQIATYSPLDTIINILLVKYGLPPAIGLLIVALI